MGSEYFKNFVGMRLNEDQLQTIPHPNFELVSHITQKTVQMGTLLGCVVIGPAFRAVKGPRVWPAVYRSAVNGGRNGAIVGLILGPVASFASMRNKSEEEVYDRSYRLRMNAGQCRVDRMCILGGLGGAGAAALLGSGPLAGAVFGISGGVLLAAIANNAGKK